MQWSQVINMKYKPKMVTSNCQSLVSKNAAKAHFTALSKLYDGPVLAVNLINKSGYEEALSMNFAKLMSAYGAANKKYEVKYR